MLTSVRGLLARIGLMKQGQSLSDETYPVVSYKIIDSDSVTSALEALPEAVKQTRPDYFKARGWCRDDADITGVHLVDAMGFWTGGSYWLLAVVRLTYRTGGSDIFFFPLAEDIADRQSPRRWRNPTPIAFGTVTESQRYGVRKWVVFDAAYDVNFRRFAPHVLSERVRREGYEPSGDVLDVYKARYGGTFHFHGPEDVLASVSFSGAVIRDDLEATFITYEPHASGQALHLFRKLRPLPEGDRATHIAARLELSVEHVVAWLTYQTDTGTEFLLYAFTQS